MKQFEKQYQWIYGDMSGIDTFTNDCESLHITNYGFHWEFQKSLIVMDDDDNFEIILPKGFRTNLFKLTENYLVLIATSLNQNRISAP